MTKERPITVAEADTPITDCEMRAFTHAMVKAMRVYFADPKNAAGFRKYLEREGKKVDTL